MKHDCIPKSDADSRELFQFKQVFMHSVFNHCLLSNMGKTLVRTYMHNMNAQLVLREFVLYMTTSSKGKIEEHGLHHYVTTIVLNLSWKWTTEQFVLHSNEQFRQLDEVSPPHEILPYPTRLTLLHTTGNTIPELRVVEPWRNFLTCPPTPLVPPWIMMVTLILAKCLH